MCRPGPGSPGTTPLQRTDSSRRDRLIVIPRIAGIGCLLLGLLVLVGWQFHLPLLERVFAGFIPMKANTAVAFVGSGTALYLATLAEPDSASRGMRLLLLAGPLLVVALAGATELQYLLRIDLGIDQFLFREDAGTPAVGDPGRMAPNTAAAFLLLNTALLLYPWKRFRALWIYQAIVLVPAYLALQAVIGYCYGLQELYGVLSFNRMALHTALGIGLLSLGLLWLNWEHGLAALLSDRRAAGYMARRLMPVGIGVPLLLGMAILSGRNPGGYDTLFGYSLLTVGCIVLFTIQVWMNAAAVARADGRRREAEGELLRSHQELEQRVKTRTAELGLVNAQLTQQIAERRMVEERIRATNIALENAVEGIAQVAAAGQYESVNAAYAQVVGRDQAELIGQEWLVTVHPDDRAQACELHRKMVHEGRAEAELRGLRPDGELFFQQLVLAAYWGPEGQFDGHYCFLKDITERVRAAEALSEARDQALAASHAKSAFLASMSHEIRTPMNAIIGTADLLWDTPLSDEQREYVRIFRRAGSTLLSLINGVLDLSKIESGRLELERTDFDLPELIEGAADFFRNTAREKGIMLTCTLAPSLPRYVVGDPVRIRQVLLNLLGNAVKFTEQGAILVTARLVEDGSGTVRFVVQDSGIGIPREKLETIFEDFTQVDASTTRSYGGTGLGLAICRRLVTLMGGNIRAESIIGQGSRFQFEIPLPVSHRLPADTVPLPELVRSVPAPAQSPAAQPAAALPETRPAASVSSDLRRILLADDSEDNRKLVLAYLRGKFQVDPVENGQIAVDRFQEQRYDLVLMDLEMPVMDGFSATRAMRAWETEQGRGRTPILALTAHALSDVERKCLDAGLDAHVTKPIKKATLLETVGSYLASGESALR